MITSDRGMQMGGEYSHTHGMHLDDMINEQLDVRIQLQKSPEKFSVEDIDHAVKGLILELTVAHGDLRDAREPENENSEHGKFDGTANEAAHVTQHASTELEAVGGTAHLGHFGCEDGICSCCNAGFLHIGGGGRD